MTPTSPYVHPKFGPLRLGRSRVSLRTHKSMARAFVLHDFLADIKAPQTFDITSGLVNWGMMGNDRLGDCTVAAKGHLVQTWTGASGKLVTLSDAVIEDAYSKECGYVPGDPSTDQGGDIATELEFFRTAGLGGYKIDAHAEVNLTQLRVQQAMYCFRGADLGINLPITAQNQVGGLWDVLNFNLKGDAAPASWGRHSIAAVNYSPSGVKVVTWGALQIMTWDFFMNYCDEMHACISPDYPKSPVPVDELVAALQEAGT